MPVGFVDPAACLGVGEECSGVDYNSVRLHAGIGYVTPNDEHTGRGEQIRQARTEGLRRAHQQRLDYHRRRNQHELVQFSAEFRVFLRNRSIQPRVWASARSVRVSTRCAESTAADAASVRKLEWVSPRLDIEAL